MTIDYRDYTNEKQEFFKAHHYDYRVCTSGLDEYNRYHKEYIFEDGAIWYEVMGAVTEGATINIHGLEINTDVKLYRTEYWSTENATSKFYYERY